VVSNDTRDRSRVGAARHGSREGVTSETPAGDSGPASSGQIVILNGEPRSGKTSIARAMQQHAAPPWLNLGVDAAMAWLPERLSPGIGLRPGGERPDLEDTVVLLYRALYDAIAALARQGFNVVVDAGLHESYSRPLPIVDDCARRLAGLPVLFVGVRCAPDVIWQRRAQTWDQHRESADRPLLDAVARWREAVHGSTYDLEVDTSESSPVDCAAMVLSRLRDGPSGRAFGALADREARGRPGTGVPSS
jgi:chloramphenicol 3-O phosphotransferase